MIAITTNSSTKVKPRAGRKAPSPRHGESSTCPLPREAGSFEKSGRLDSNQRPFDPQSNALPDCATARFFCQSAGLSSDRSDLSPRRPRYQTALRPELYARSYLSWSRWGSWRGRGVSGGENVTIAAENRGCVVGRGVRFSMCRVRKTVVASRDSRRRE